jgi:hypothetical protein
MITANFAGNLTVPVMLKPVTVMRYNLNQATLLWCETFHTQIFTIYEKSTLLMTQFNGQTDHKNNKTTSGIIRHTGICLPKFRIYPYPWISQFHILTITLTSKHTQPLISTTYTDKKPHRSNLLLLLLNTYCTDPTSHFNIYYTV